MIHHLKFEDLKGAQISLRFDVEPTHVAAYIHEAVTKLELDFFLSTEGKGRVRAVRRALGRDWRVQARGEYLIGTRRAVLGRWLPFPLPRLRIVEGADWTNGPHAGTRHFAAMFSNFRIRATGQRLRLIVVHATSGVQVGSRWARLIRRVRPYQIGVHKLGDWLAKPAPEVVQVIGMDSNLENHLEVWRDYLERELGLPSIWHFHRPVAGTHGRRLIDTMHSNVAVTDQGVSDLPRDHGLDHDLAFATFHPRRFIGGRVN